jgi:hypothetical protein
MDEMSALHRESTQPYAPIAIYYEEADSLEYIRRDKPCVYRRIDELLTLILAMDSRDPIGFRIKGFRHFYNKHMRGKLELSNSEFPKLVCIVEEAVSLLGDKIFDEHERLTAYKLAREIAETDDVRLSQVPEAA